MNHLALPVPVQRCAMGCALFLRRHGMTGLAMNEPDRVSLIVCGRCLTTLIAHKSVTRKGA